MQVIEEFRTITGKGSGNDNEMKFSKIYGVIFCRTCGNQIEESPKDNVQEICPVCDGKDFIYGEFAAYLAGYISLDKKGMLKKYYDSVVHRRFKGVRMNNKRIIHRLLVRNGFLVWNDREAEKMIGRIMWKKT